MLSLSVCWQDQEGTGQRCRRCWSAAMIAETPAGYSARRREFRDPAAFDIVPVLQLLSVSQDLPMKDPRTHAEGAVIPARLAPLILALTFTGGFSIMSIELLAGRMLAPFFGSSIYVWGSIITIFMLSLSLGYLLGGRLSLRAPSLFRFGILFLVAGSTITPLLLAAGSIMEAVFVTIEDPRYGSLVASFALFFVPTAAMGTISPYAVRLLVDTAGHSGNVAGLLYFVSTLGSALGTLMTSFYFVLWFEVKQILVSLGVALALCGIIALLAHRAVRKASAGVAV